MPALNFKKQFAPAVRAGLEVRAAGRNPFPDEQPKLQTIRARGKRQFRVGDKLMLFTGMRTAWCDKLGDAICKDVTSIYIVPKTREVRVPNSTGTMWIHLGIEEIEALAIADGFQSADDFFAFFAETHADSTFSGQLIKW